LRLDFSSPADTIWLGSPVAEGAIKKHIELGPYLLEKSLPDAPISCDGEPEPEREAPDILEEGLRPGERPNGDLAAPPEGGSSGDELEVGEVERF
jgi:hypothetical protein